MYKKKRALSELHEVYECIGFMPSVFGDVTPKLPNHDGNTYFNLDVTGSTAYIQLTSNMLLLPYNITYRLTTYYLLFHLVIHSFAIWPGLPHKLHNLRSPCLARSVSRRRMLLTCCVDRISRNLSMSFSVILRFSISFPRNCGPSGTFKQVTSTVPGSYGVRF